MSRMSLRGGAQRRRSKLTGQIASGTSSPRNDVFHYRSPLGWIEVIEKEGQLCTMGFVKRSDPKRLLQGALKRQLDAYFTGKKKDFSFSAPASGTVFQKKVWCALRSIPCGRTVSYKEVAAKIGRKKSVRAVARAIAQNPLMILTPCHRVIGTDGSLTGYAYGLRKKAWLLKHELSSPRKRGSS